MSCINKVWELEKVLKLMTKPLIWVKLDHHISYVILPESCLTISKISTRPLQIGITPILVLILLTISKCKIQQGNHRSFQMMLVWAL